MSSKCPLIEAISGSRQLLVGIVLGGIYGGVFTPTEAAAVAAVYAFFITVFVYGELKLMGRVVHSNFLGGEKPVSAP